MSIKGFWDGETLARFGTDLPAAVVRLGCSPGDHLVLCDVTEASIQPQQILEGLQGIVAAGPTRARKLALYTTNPLSRRQARRFEKLRDDLAVFGSEAEALAWLLKPAASQAADWRNTSKTWPAPAEASAAPSVP
jgi:uncharacterized protein (DUF2384 family)